MKSDELLLDDTGERMIPEFSKGQVVYGEHVLRYSAILPIVKDKEVLDIASGSGYGSALISEVAKKVFGVDVDKPSVDYSKKLYSKYKNLEYLVGDGTKIPLEDNSIDVVVSFETIEHIEGYKIFLKEIKRVLKPDGVMILSTPNDVEYPENNHFHVHEFKKKELTDLVSKYFLNQHMLYQVNWVYSGLLDPKSINMDWTLNQKLSNKSPIEDNKVLYYFIIASDNKDLPSIDDQGVLSGHWSEKANQISELVLKDHMDKQAEIIKYYQDKFESSNALVEELSAQNQTLSDRVEKFESSKAYKMYKSLKKLK